MTVPGDAHDASGWLGLLTLANLRAPVSWSFCRCSPGWVVAVRSAQPPVRRHPIRSSYGAMPSSAPASGIARMDRAGVRERWRHDCSLARYANGVALPSHFLGVTFALPPGFDHDSAHSARSRSVPRIARLASSSAGTCERSKTRGHGPIVEVLRPEFVADEAFGGARATSRCGAATAPWGDAGRSPALSRGRDRRPAGGCAPASRRPGERRGHHRPARLAPVPPGTEGRPGPGTRANLIPDHMGSDVTPAMLPFPAHLRAFYLPFQIAEHVGTEEQIAVC
jgi:hypothetical protein